MKRTLTINSLTVDKFGAVKFTVTTPAAPRNVKTEEQVAALEADVQDVVNHMQSLHFTLLRRKAQDRLDKAEAGTKAYDNASEAYTKWDTMLGHIDAGSWHNSFANTLGWALCKRARRLGNGRYALAYMEELCNELSNAADVAETKMIMLGFCRLRFAGMEEYGCKFNLRLTDADAANVYHYIRSGKYRWTRNNIRCLQPQDEDIVEQVLFAVGVKTFNLEREERVKVIDTMTLD